MELLGYIEYRGMEYPVPILRQMTPRERSLCRRITNMSPYDAIEALEGGDDSIFLWLLAVASSRQGAKIDLEAVWEEEGFPIKFTDIEAREKQEAADQGPPGEEAVAEETPNEPNSETLPPQPEPDGPPSIRSSPE